MDNIELECEQHFDMSADEQRAIIARMRWYPSNIIRRLWWTLYRTFHRH